MSATAPILPGARLGVFGGGQLGRMFASSAARLGYRVIVFAPEADPPGAHLAHEHVRSDYLDESAVRAFARRCDVVTLEFENIPAGAVDIASAETQVRPGRHVLEIAQDRIRERAFLTRHGFPVSPFVIVRSSEDLTAAVRRLGAPFVLKAARFGYDGKGQRKVVNAADARGAWAELSGQPSLAEAWVDLACELSVLVARTPSGTVQTFGPIRNEHSDHILDLSIVPAGIPASIEREALELARGIAEGLELEGLVCVELFVRSDGALLVNELAPRPHNSGHLTIEGCDCSQFEQQVRAICDLPLRAMSLRGPTVMANLLGGLWEAGEPDWLAVLRDPDVSLHLYGKADPRPARKMGHLTATGATVEVARQSAIAARSRLIRKPMAWQVPEPRGSGEAHTMVPAFSDWSND